MALGYIDLENINHLNLQASGHGIYKDPKWRESYYFNMTDPKSGISLITTIGLLPNKKRSNGFVLIIKDRKVLFFKLLANFKRPVANKYTYRLKGLEYSVEGVGWRLRNQTKRCTFDLHFSPINKIYPYVDDETDRVFTRVGTQHYEQSGTFEGRIELDHRTIKIGPCFGHRDHSWGIRDWRAVDRWRLFCCALTKDFAINLWEGRIGKIDLVKGYVFDGNQNKAIKRSKVNTNFQRDGRTPEGATLTIQDEMEREYEIQCKVIKCVPFPLNGSVLYETVSQMRYNGIKGSGLLEYLFHEVSRVQKMRAYLDFFRDVVRDLTCYKR